MIFSEALDGSLERQREAKSLLSYVRELERGLNSDALAKIHKGMIFVIIYGSVEYTVSECCLTFFSHLKYQENAVLDYKNNLIGAVMEPEFTGLINAANSSRWSKKIRLIEGILSNDRSNLNEAAFFDASGNIGNSQIRDIWETLELAGFPFSDGININLDEIKNNRNAIAHGRSTAEGVGKSYTVIDLNKKMDAAESLCNHIIGSFEDACDRKLFLKHG